MQHGPAGMLSLRLASLMLATLVGACYTAAAEKVWFDEKGLRQELHTEFKSKNYFQIRDDRYSVTTNFHVAKTETNGLQLRPTAFLNVRGSAIWLFMEFDNKANLIEVGVQLTYADVWYTKHKVKLSDLKLPKDSSREVVSAAFADAVQKLLDNTKVKKKEGVRTPNFGAGARYWVAMVAKHVWHGPKVTDHRRGTSGVPAPRGGKRG